MGGRVEAKTSFQYFFAKGPHPGLPEKKIFEKKLSIVSNSKRFPTWWIDPSSNFLDYFFKGEIKYHALEACAAQPDEKTYDV